MFECFTALPSGLRFFGFLLFSIFSNLYGLISTSFTIQLFCYIQYQARNLHSTHLQSNLTSSNVQNGYESVPHRRPRRSMFSGSARSIRFRRPSSFSRYQSLCLIATDHCVWRPIIRKKLGAGSNFRCIVPNKEQLVHPISDRVGPS